MGIASMVKSDRLQMALIAREIEHKLQIAVQVGGAEAEAAILGALTTPGTTRPLAILDLGAGSTDASIINAQERSAPLTWPAPAIWSRSSPASWGLRTATWRKRSKNIRWQKSKACFICVMKTAASSFSVGLTTDGICPRLRGETG